MKKSTNELLASVLYHGLGGAMLLGGFYCMIKGGLSGSSSPAESGALFLAGLFMLFVAAILLGPRFAHMLSAPWGKLMYPDAKFDRPQPLYSLAEAQARREEYEKAMTTYEGIAEDFPEEIRPWIGMVEIAVTALKDVNRADLIYQRGIEQLTNQEAQESFARMYRGIRSRTKEEPEWGKKRTIDLVPSPKSRKGGRRGFR